MSNQPIQIKYTHAVIAVDVAVFRFFEGELQVLLIQMKKKPFEEMWAFPGGLVKTDEDVDDAPARVLKEKVGLSGIFSSQVSVFGEPHRDPFGRVVSVAYLGLCSDPNANTKNSDEYSDALWWPVSKLPRMAYDHKQMAGVVLAKLRQLAESSNVIAQLLPKRFTFSDLLLAYEAVLGKKLDKRNFRKKCLALNLVFETEEISRGGAFRPAKLFEFTSSKFKSFEVF
jgi:8-oxo-dGTP diphosphatase